MFRCVVCHHEKNEQPADFCSDCKDQKHRKFSITELTQNEVEEHGGLKRALLAKHLTFKKYSAFMNYKARRYDIILELESD